MTTIRGLASFRLGREGFAFLPRRINTDNLIPRLGVSPNLCRKDINLHYKYTGASYFNGADRDTATTITTVNTGEIIIMTVNAGEDVHDYISALKIRGKKS